RPRPLDEGSAGCLGSARAAMIAMFRPRLNRHRHGSLLNPTDSQLRPRPKIIPRAEHPISRANISSNALKVLYRLKNAGYSAFVVGGGVRDLLLGRHPKDFDVVTDALPEDVDRLFRNCRLIGRRFRLAHVRFGRDVVEVATFRATGNGEDDDRQHDESGRILRDNVYGTIDEDIWRRDFTVNALLQHRRLHALGLHHRPRGDRKSTRLNSSHVKISYAVFCLKKKT